MSWLNASEYVLMEAAVRDRLDELHAAREQAPADGEPSGWWGLSDGAGAAHDGGGPARDGATPDGDIPVGAARRRAVQATRWRRAALCPACPGT